MTKNPFILCSFIHLFVFTSGQRVTPGRMPLTATPVKIPSVTQSKFDEEFSCCTLESEVLFSPFNKHYIPSDAVVANFDDHHLSIEPSLVGIVKRPVPGMVNIGDFVGLKVTEVVSIDEGHRGIAPPQRISNVSFDLFDSWKRHEDKIMNDFEVLTNPKNCSIKWKLIKTGIPQSTAQKLFVRRNNYYFGRSYVDIKHPNGSESHALKSGLLTSPGILHLHHNNGFMDVRKNYQVMYIDCKESAERNIRGVSVEFKNPQIDLKKIEMTHQKAVTFFYSSNFINYSPQKYRETFEYSENKYAIISWSDYVTETKDWVTDALLFRSNLRIDPSVMIQHESGHQQITRTETNSRSDTKTIKRIGVIELDPFSRASVIGVHYDIQNATIPNIAFVKLSSGKMNYNCTRIKAVMIRVGIMNGLEVDTSRSQDSCYLKIPGQFKVNLGLNSSITIEGEPLRDPKTKSTLAAQHSYNLTVHNELLVTRSSCQTVECLRHGSSLSIFIASLLMSAFVFTLIGIWIGKYLLSKAQAKPVVKPPPARRPFIDRIHQ